MTTCDSARGVGPRCGKTATCLDLFAKCDTLYLCKEHGDEHKSYGHDIKPIEEVEAQ